MIQNDRLRLTLPNDLAWLPVVLGYVRQVAERFGFGEGDRYKIEVAVEECVANVIQHAFDAAGTASFDVICERVPMGMRVVVKEMGLPFDPARLPEYVPAADLDQVPGSGMGLFLMKRLMDDVSFHNLGLEGKETRLVKYLPSRPITDYCTPAELAPPPVKEPEAIREKIDYDVRALAPEEAIEVSRCAYRSHGYTFFDEHIYYPDRLVELNRSGKMVSAVAVSRGGEFMGHAALVYPRLGARIAELTFVFVNVEYRGQGCMNRLSEYLFTVPKRDPLAGVYAYAVTNHVFTQKVMVKYGIHDCGIELATSPATWFFKGITPEREGNAQRISVALGFKYLTPPERLTLYPPPQHRAMIERLYRHLGADHDYALPAGAGAALPAQESAFEVDIHEAEQNVEIAVVRYGVNVVREMRHLLHELCVKGMAAINLSLSLEDPATCALTAELEAMGFFFSGILPRTDIGDALILQYLNNVELDYGKIQVYTDVAREILEYIRERDPNRE